MNFSTPLGIAAVSYILRELLKEGLSNRNIPLSTSNVSVLPPDIIDKNDEENRLNLFMYMATPNQGWSNQMYPSRNNQGELVNNPPLALDLHYLLSAYGEKELYHELILGYGMLILHDNPLISKDFISNSFTNLVGNSSPNISSEIKSLATSGLANQIEFVKITPETLNTEEISRLWAAFGAKYRPTAAYKVTVVLLQSEKPVKSALPVRQRNLYVLPFHQPTIEKIASMKQEDDSFLENQKIVEGDWLAIQGYQLKGEIVRVQIGDNSIVPSSTNVSEKLIKVKLPNTLQAGMHIVQIIHQINMGSPHQPHKGVSSNAAVFFLVPSFDDTPAVTGSVGSFDISIQNIKPGIKTGQKVEFLLNEINTLPAVLPKAYQFKVLEPTNGWPNSGTQLHILGIDVKSGDYLARLKVDNAESALHFDTASGYNKPKLTIP